MGLYPDAECSVAETGTSGIVLTTQRLLFKKYAVCRSYQLDAAGRVEFMTKDGHATVHIYESGHAPAVLKLAPCTCIRPLVSELTIPSGASCRSTAGVGAVVWPSLWHDAHARLNAAAPSGAGWAEAVVARPRIANTRPKDVFIECERPQWGGSEDPRLRMPV